LDGASEEQNPYANLADTGAETGIRGAYVALGHAPHNYVTICAEVDDVTVTAGVSVRRGGSPTVGPLPTPDGRRFAWIKDPDANMIGAISR